MGFKNWYKLMIEKEIFLNVRKYALENSEKDLFRF